jgi:hypothetical protein
MHPHASIAAPNLAELRRLTERMAGAHETREVLPFGIPEMDAALPGGGLAIGAVHEISEGGPRGCHAPLRAGGCHRFRPATTWPAATQLCLRASLTACFLDEEGDARPHRPMATGAVDGVLAGGELALLSRGALFVEGSGDSGRYGDSGTSACLTDTRRDRTRHVDHGRSGGDRGDSDLRPAHR